MDVRRLLSNLANIDRNMAVRVVGNGPLLATYLAIAKQTDGDNIVILSAIEATDAMRLDGGDGTTLRDQYPADVRDVIDDRGELVMAVACITGAISNARRFVEEGHGKWSPGDLDAMREELDFTNQWLRDLAEFIDDERGSKG